MIRQLFFSSVALAAMIASASAADLPAAKGPPVYAPSPPPVFSWTGVYIGGQVGYEWGKSANDYYGPLGGLAATGQHNDDGVVGGGHVGYDYQISQFVIGIEGDVNGSNYGGSGVFTNGVLARHVSTDVDGSVRGRVGITFDRVLIYGTGGAAFGSIRNTATNLLTGGINSQTTGRVGWTVGGGIEYAIDNNWSVRAEYRYTDYGRYTFPISVSAIPLTDRVRETDNRVQAGFSYRFDMFAPPTPVIAKY